MGLRPHVPVHVLVDAVLCVRRPYVYGCDPTLQPYAALLEPMASNGPRQREATPQSSGCMGCAEARGSWMPATDVCNRSASGRPAFCERERAPSAIEPLLCSAGSRAEGGWWWCPGLALLRRWPGSERLRHSSTARGGLPQALDSSSGGVLYPGGTGGPNQK